MDIGNGFYMFALSVLPQINTPLTTHTLPPCYAYALNTEHLELELPISCCITHMSGTPLLAPPQSRILPHGQLLVPPCPLASQKQVPSP